MKKWILKSEVNKILKTYSVQKDEFEPWGNIEYTYMSNAVNGYMISIEQEKIRVEGDTDRETGRIIVSHTKQNGRKTYQDVWERDKNDKLQFCFRNLWNQPSVDLDYLKDLEKENEALKQAGRKLQEENSMLKKQIKAFKYENIELKKDYQHNARGAGRKPSNERKRSIERLRNLLGEGKNVDEIMEIMGISQATYYRYKRDI